MSTIYDDLKMRDNIANKFSKLTIPTITFNTAILQNFDIIQSQLNMFHKLDGNLAESLAIYQQTLNSFSQQISKRVSQQFSNSAAYERLTAFSQNLNHICIQLPNISQKLNLGLNISEENANKLIESINIFSLDIQHGITESTDIDLSYTEVIADNVESSETFDWKFLIPIIISLISLFIQISDKIVANDQLKENIETQGKIINILEQINNCLNDMEKIP
ncbi:hypothetical protein C3B72_04885 [Clostridium tetani]|uniref:hypothetical protein n=1 Tax=Clostridium tetani TaxID=1513 RepID=UPI000D204766|nr:hypothetical protein [Clostridium tetani]AVP54494.1 hypothetical protein C3B72_04885 [Clostridium tetani]